MRERSRVFALTGDDVVRFELDGARASDPSSLLRGVGARCLAIHPRDPDRLYVGTLDSDLYASDDGGLTWRDGNDGLDHRRVLSVAVSPSHQESGTSVVYAGTEPSNLYRSEDGGRRWQRLPALRELPSEPRWSFPPRPWIHHVGTIALHPTDPDWLAVGIELGGVMRSQDAGASWIDHNPQAHSDAHQLLTHPLAPDRVYEAAGQGIARSEDRGESWTKLQHGLDRHYAWAGARPRRPRPLVRRGQPLTVRHPRRRRRTSTPVALARRRVDRGRHLGRLPRASPNALRADRAGRPAQQVARRTTRRDAAAQRRRRRKLVATGARAVRHPRPPSPPPPDDQRASPRSRRRSSSPCALASQPEAIAPKAVQPVQRATGLELSTACRRRDLRAPARRTTRSGISGGIRERLCSGLRKRQRRRGRCLWPFVVCH